MAELDALRSRKREKPILSCGFCRARKLRCDRQAPCGACVRRGKATECTYSSSEQDRQHAIDYRPHARRQQARQRVVHLENLVTEMRDRMQSMPSSSAAVGRPPLSSQPDRGSRNAAKGADVASRLSASHEEGGVIEDMGKLSLTEDLAIYTGSSHWVTILEDIQRLKDELSEDQTPLTASLDPAPSLDTAASIAGSPATRISLLTSGPSLPREQILSMVPPRDVVDKHVSDFFSYFDMAPFILHRSKFLAEYARFWDNPPSASVMWLGLLFSVITMSSFLTAHQQLKIPDDTPESTMAIPSESMVQAYRDMTIHCLVAGDYLRPRQYTIETLMLHFAVDQMVSIDGTVANWVLMGVIVRLAFRMGLHRDPSHWPFIQPLQAELRRRLWIALYQMDFFTSVQVGLPRIIKDTQCDTQPPAYLVSPDLDQNLDAANNETTSEGSLVEPTPFLFIIQRRAIVKVAAEIYDATEERPAPSLATLSALTAQLGSATDRIPAAFKYTSFESSIADGPMITLHRVVLDTLIQKTVYLLHRRSFVIGVGEDGVNSTRNDMSTSQDKCIQAALTILKHQERMSRETRPGGLLFDIRWKVAVSLNHEVLQATMMLCFALRYSESTAPDTNSSPVAHLKTRDDILDTLSQVKRQWENKADLSAETQRALHAITSVLQQKQKVYHLEDELQNQTLPTSGDPRVDMPPSLASRHDFFDPMLAAPGQRYFDFNMFDYEQAIGLETIDPLLFDTNVGYDGNDIQG